MTFPDPDLDGKPPTMKLYHLTCLRAAVRSAWIKFAAPLLLDPATLDTDDTKTLTKLAATLTHLDNAIANERYAIKNQ